MVPRRGPIKLAADLPTAVAKHDNGIPYGREESACLCNQPLVASKFLAWHTSGQREAQDGIPSSGRHLSFFSVAPCL